MRNDKRTGLLLGLVGLLVLVGVVMIAVVSRWAQQEPARGAPAQVQQSPSTPDLKETRAPMPRGLDYLDDLAVVVDALNWVAYQNPGEFLEDLREIHLQDRSNLSGHGVQLLRREAWFRRGLSQARLPVDEFLRFYPKDPSVSKYDPPSEKRDHFWAVRYIEEAMAYYELAREAWQQLDESPDVISSSSPLFLKVYELLPELEENSYHEYETDKVFEQACAEAGKRVEWLKSDLDQRRSATPAK